MRCVISGPLNSSINDSQLSISERLERGTDADRPAKCFSHTNTDTLLEWKTNTEVCLKQLADVITFLKTHSHFYSFKIVLHGTVM